MQIVYRTNACTVRIGERTLMYQHNHRPITGQSPANHRPITGQSPANHRPNTGQSPAKHRPITGQSPANHRPNTGQPVNWQKQKKKSRPLESSVVRFTSKIIHLYSLYPTNSAHCYTSSLLIISIGVSGYSVGICGIRSSCVDRTMTRDKFHPCCNVSLIKTSRFGVFIAEYKSSSRIVMIIIQ